MSFKQFTVNEDSAIDPELDPDTNFFEIIFSLDTIYFSNIDSECITVLHRNTRSMKKTLEIFKNSLRIYSLISVQFVYLKHGVNQ